MLYRTWDVPASRYPPLAWADSTSQHGLSDDESIRLVRSAIDRGITFMDNSWDYNEGQSEIRMGKALKDGYRQKVFLMTKIDGPDERSSGEADRQRRLERLQTDHIDLVAASRDHSLRRS